MVTALAAFLGLLALWHTPIQRITAGTDLRLEVPPSETSVAPASQQLNWNELIRKEMNAALANEKLVSTATQAGLITESTSAPEAQIANEIFRRLKVESRTSSDGAAALVSIFYTGPKGRASIEFVRQLADNFARQIQSIHLRPEPDTSTASVTEAVIQAENRMKNARLELDQVLADGLRAIRDLEQTKTTNAEQPRVIERPNPAWSELEHHLEEAKASHERVSSNRSDDHPIVIRWKSRIESLEEQLQHIPKYLKSVAQTGVRKSTPPTRAQQIERVMKSDIYQSKLSEFDEAEREFNLALMQNSQAPVPNRTPTQVTVIPVNSARVVARHGKVLSRSRFFAIAIISFAVAILVSRFGVDESYGIVFRSVAQVRESIGPIVGSLRLTEGRPKTSVAARYHFNRATVLLSELFIGAAIVILAMFSLTDSRFASHLVDDPFSAYSQAVSKVTQWFL